MPPTLFEFPQIHSFPPFYTKQPNSTVLANQLESWCKIILDFCLHYQISHISPQGEPLYLQVPSLNFTTLPLLFENPEIDRSCSTEFRHAIISYFINTARGGEYLDPKNTSRGVLVFYYPLQRWGDALYQHMADTGQIGTIFTIFELTQDEQSNIPDNLRNMDPKLLGLILERILVKQNKAQLLMSEDNKIGGVKFI